MAKKGALAEKAAELGAAVEGLLTGTPVAAEPVKAKKKAKKVKKAARKTAKKAKKAPKKAAKKAKKAKKKKAKR